MNPIANLPATQNLNRAQQSQGYNRQYFGGDEVDEVVLSNQDEQAKKKKMWTIGGAILGTLALVGGTLFGLNVYGKIGKDASHLLNLKQLMDGDKKMASIASTNKAWTGATWGGVAETIKATLSGEKNSKGFENVIVVAKQESIDTLKKLIPNDFITKYKDKLMFLTKDQFKDKATEYGQNEKNLIMVDSTEESWYSDVENMSLGKEPEQTLEEKIKAAQDKVKEKEKILKTKTEELENKKKELESKQKELNTTDTNLDAAKIVEAKKAAADEAAKKQNEALEAKQKAEAEAANQQAAADEAAKKQNEALEAKKQAEADAAKQQTAADEAAKKQNEALEAKKQAEAVEEAKKAVDEAKEAVDEAKEAVEEAQKELKELKDKDEDK